MARQPHHDAAARSLATGLRRHGIACDISPNIEGDGDVGACWGWKIGKRIAAQGRHVLVMELGYVGERHRWSSLAWDGLNGRGRIAKVTDGGERWRKHFGNVLQPWRDGGECAVVMGQVNGDASILDVNIGAWYADAAVKAERFGLPVFFRRHPLACDFPFGIDRIGGSLASALQRAAVVVTFNSNAGVDAVLAGVPTIACDIGSMAWSVAGRGLDAEPPKPDRSEWCAALAWRQWTREEIENGEAWEFLRLAL